MNKHVLFVLWICLFSAVYGEEMTYRIAGPEKPLPHEVTALKELKHYLSLLVKPGGKVEIAGKSPVTFHVGDTAFAAGKGLVTSKLESERWILKSFGSDLVLLGGGTRGTLYAVYHFLEDYCDVHWWNQYEEYVPAPADLKFDAFDRNDKPFFIYRDIFRGSHLPNDNGRFAIRNRLNADGHAFITSEYGGSFSYGDMRVAHTFNYYIPPEKYMKSNPEYFSLRDGKRVGGQFKGQLCLSNFSMRKIFLERLLDNIKQGEANAAAKNVPMLPIYDLSMNDNNCNCQCENCRKIVEKHGESGLLLLFLNDIAKEVRKQYPDVYLSTLAYFYNAPPPKGVRAESNLLIRLCDTESNMAAPFMDEQNRKFRDQIQAWKLACHNLVVWDYSITYTKGCTGLPFPSEFFYSDMFKFCSQNSVKGFLLEHEHAYAADMFELKLFLEMKLMENPFADADKLSDLFYSKYYREAAPHIKEYRRLLEAACRKNKCNITFFTPFSRFNHMKENELRACHLAMDKAEAAVNGDPVLFQRVRRARLGLDRLTAKGKLVIFLHEPGREMPKMNTTMASHAAKRLKATWLSYLKHFARPEKLLKEAESEMQTYGDNFDDSKPPKKFAGQKYYDLDCRFFSNFAPGDVVFIKDPLSESGTSVARTEVSKSHYYSLPYEIGLYDEKGKRNVLTMSYKEAPANEGYNWFNLGRAIIPEKSSLYSTRAWTIQVPLPFDVLVGKKFDIWASVKFSGPHFYPGKQTGTDYIWLERFVLVPCN